MTIVLVGGGSHAFDIAYHSGTLIGRTYAHHKDYQPVAGDNVLIGVNDPRLRARIADELGVQDLAWIHPYSYYGPSNLIGTGTHLNYGSSMVRTTIGAHCTIGPGVTICGDVVIGNRVLVGAGATICDRVTIEDDATVGAGAVVLPCSRIPESQTWVGVPAKPK